MKLAVVLPAGQNENDWLVVNVMAFFNNANITYSKFAHLCTTDTCPHTTAGQLANYLWMDPVTKTPVDIPACEYFPNLFEWILKENFHEPTKFPPFGSDEESLYPANFKAVVADISRRIFRTYAHLYHHHHAEIGDNSIIQADHFEKSFKLFYLFVIEFKLVAAGDLAPMESLISTIV